MTTTKTTRDWLKSIIESEGGNIENAAKWMARNFKGMGGVKFFRDQLEEVAR